MTKQTETQHYELWTYDVWGPDEDGYIVNDRYHQCDVRIRVKATINNVGTDAEFTSFYPTDQQLDRVVGSRIPLDWSGEYLGTLYADDEDGRPVCELVRIPE